MARPYNVGKPCQIHQSGTTLTFINENKGQSAGKFVDAGTVVASNWPGLNGEKMLKGKVTNGGKRIDWANGGSWVR